MVHAKLQTCQIEGIIFRKVGTRLHPVAAVCLTLVTLQSHTAETRICRREISTTVQGTPNLSKLFGEVTLPTDSERSEFHNPVKSTFNSCQPAVICSLWIQNFCTRTIRQTDCSITIRTVHTLHTCARFSVTVDCTSVPMWRSHTSVDPSQDLTEPFVFYYLFPLQNLQCCRTVFHSVRLLACRLNLMKPTVH